MSRKGEPREPAWTEGEISFLRENYIRVPIAGIAAHLDRSYESVRRKAAKVGAQRQDWQERFTPEEDELLRVKYATSPMSEMTALMGRHHNSIRLRARMLGLVNEEQAKRALMASGIRHDYFGRIDSPMKAYLLGLLATDGCVASASNSVSLKVAAKDIELAELMRDELSPHSRVRIDTQPPLPGYTKERQSACFSVASAQMKADLGNLGVTPRKTFTLQWPSTLEPSFVAPFILGCFDGDGCLYRKTPIWDLFSATPDFLSEVQAAILEHTGVKAAGPRLTRGRLYRIRLSGRGAFTVDAWMCRDVPGLARKRLSPDALAA